MAGSPSHVRQSGAVMIEALLSVGSFTLMFAGMLFVHALAAADLRAAEQARRAAWEHAATGCGASGFALRDIVTQAWNGEFPAPNALFPSQEGEGAASAQVRGVFGRMTGRVQRTVRIPCANARVEAQDAQNTGWLMELIR